jgi:LuxR family maltose regulon positive regulatory protein
MKTKVLIADDHPFTRVGIRSILEGNDTIEIIGEAGDGKEAVKRAIDHQPDIIIMDISMPQLSGIDATREILKKHPEVKVIALSIHSGQKFVKEMLNAGAVGYLLKDEAPEELMIAVGKVLNGDIFLSSSVTRVALKADAKQERRAEINILASKLHRPQLLPDYVLRTKIVHELESNAKKPLSLISAGPGYGKSVAVSQWLEQAEYLKTWISLDQEHNDLRTFLSYLVAAVEKIFPGMIGQSANLVSTPILPPTKEISRVLINELCDIEQNFILVLDDYHMINEPLVHEVLNELINFPPPSLHLCIVTRRDPPLKIKRLQIAGRVTEIRMEALSFTIDEIAELFNQSLGIELNDQSLQEIYLRTEGWIIALRLISMIKKTPEEIGNIFDSVGGGLHTISEYLLEEVLSNEPQHIQDLLIGSSILNRFCESLLRKVTREDEKDTTIKAESSSLIPWLTKFNLFVIHLDAEKSWFRYHHLFQDFLLSQLKKTRNPQQIQKLHISASQWFEKHDFLEEAINHAINIPGYGLAAEIVKTHRMLLLNTSQWQVLNRLHQKLPKTIVEKDLELLLVDAYLSFFLADHTRVGEAVNMMESLIRGLDLKSMLLGEYHFFLGYTTMYLKKDPITCLHHMKIALKEIPVSAAAPRSLVELFYPMFVQISGQYSDAIKWLEETISKSEDFALIRKNRLFLSLFLTSTSEGDLNQVENYYVQGLKLARETKIDDTLANCLMIVGELFMRRGDWQKAIPYFEEVVKLKYNVHTRCVIDCITSLVVIYSILGKQLKCMELIKELENFTKDLGDYHERFVWSCKTRYHLFLKDTQTVRDLMSQYSSNFVHFVFWIDLPEITYSRALIFEGSEENLSLAVKELNKLDEMATSQNNWIHVM